jgi:large subunit ribosomal protein L28e
MSTVSQDLLWLLIKKQNRFLYKQGGGTTRQVQFSSEPNNLLNKNTYKFSGLANLKSVGIHEEGDHIVVHTTNPKKVGKPSKVSTHLQG